MRKLLLWGALMPLLCCAQRLDSLHVMIDAEAADGTPFTYKTFQEASAHFTDGVTAYIRPGVYWIDNPDDPAVRVGKGGREPFGMTIRCPHLTLIGLGDSPQDVVLASQRGQTQGAVGNFTMFDFWCKSLKVENLTMGNYCNVDLVYPRNPQLNRKKRSETITQAHVGYVHGDSLTAKNVRFISRLNLNPLNGARHSYYEDCHFECTDDALNGTAVYRHCNFDLYGQKPFWSTFREGALFVDCDFHVKGSSREMYFTKQGGPVTLIDCRYHASTDSIYIGWTAYPQRWLRCYQKHFTLNGKPYVIGSRQRENTVVCDAIDMDTQRPPYLSINRHEVEMQVGDQPITLRVEAAGRTVAWHLPASCQQLVALSSMQGDSVALSIACDDIGEPITFPVSAFAVGDSCRQGVAVCMVTVKPAQLPPPSFVRKPQIVRQDNTLTLDYALRLDALRDESCITWYRGTIPVSTSHTAPQRTYTLTEADQGQTLMAMVAPRHQRSNFGAPESAEITIPSGLKPQERLSTDFHDFPVQQQPEVKPGFWTVDGYKPEDTAAFDWSFDAKKPMWEYGEGFNGAVGMGLLQAQRGARLRYTPMERKYGDMHLVLKVDPTKTAGQGFGSATGQYMDVCLKFDNSTLTGYGLRIIRTTKHAKAVDFMLIKYDHGKTTPLTEPVASTCYRTNCTISVDFIGNQLSAHVETSTPQPADSTLPKQVDLKATVTPNAFGGVHIQHTGSCGESTTMLHQLDVCWKLP